MQTFTEKEIGDAYDKAPVLVQDALSSDDFAKFGFRLQVEYKLHVDVINKVEDEIRNLLIGLIDPKGFVIALQELGIQNKTAQLIVKDLNEMIFIPLQKAMKGEVSELTTNSVPDKAPVATEAPQTQDKSQNPVPAPVVEPAPTPAPAPERYVPPQISSVVTPPIRLTPEPVAQQQAPAPAPRPISNPVPNTAPAPASFMPLTPQTAQATAKEPENKIVKEYAADPYREPIQ